MIKFIFCTVLPPGASKASLSWRNPGTPLVILQINCNVISHCLQKLFSLFYSEDILVPCIQESKIKPYINLHTNSFPNFTVHKNRPGLTGGERLIALIHRFISCTNFPTNSLLLTTPFHNSCHQQDSLQHINIHIYFPFTLPAFQIPCPLFTFILTFVVDNLNIDFNFHSFSWYSQTTVNQAEVCSPITYSIIDSYLALLNLDSSAPPPFLRKPFCCQPYKNFYSDTYSF